MNFREFLENAWWQNMSNVATSSPDPGTFYDVLTDRGPDSLVVHWRNKFNRQKVNSLIDQYFTSAGIKFAPREARATDGFDMNKKDKFEGGSHSQLVAQAMAKLMSQNPQFKQMPQPKKQDWLKQWITYFNGLNPQQMYQYITN